MASVLEDWAAAMPAEADVRVSSEGEAVDVVTCDPGAEATLLEDGGRSSDTISLVAIRSELARQILDAGGDVRQARCFSRGIVTEIGYDLMLTEQPTPAQQTQIQQIAAAQGQACR